MLTVDEAFMKQHERLVRFVARKFCPPNKPEFEDDLAWARLGLLQAARQFDPERSVKFSTFAFGYMRGYLSRAIRFHSTLLSVPSGKTFPAALPEVLRFEALVPEDGEEHHALEVLDLSDDTDIPREVTTRLTVR